MRTTTTSKKPTGERRPNDTAKATPPADPSSNALRTGLADLIGRKEGETDLDMLFRLKCQLESGQDSESIADRWMNFLTEAAKIVPTSATSTASTTIAVFESAGAIPVFKEGMGGRT